MQSSKNYFKSKKRHFGFPCWKKPLSPTSYNNQFKTDERKGKWKIGENDECRKAINPLVAIATGPGAM